MPSNPQPPDPRFLAWSAPMSTLPELLEATNLVAAAAALLIALLVARELWRMQLGSPPVAVALIGFFAVLAVDRSLPRPVPWLQRRTGRGDRRRPHRAARPARSRTLGASRAECSPPSTHPDSANASTHAPSTMHTTRATPHREPLSAIKVAAHTLERTDLNDATREQLIQRSSRPSTAPLRSASTLTDRRRRHGFDAIPHVPAPCHPKGHAMQSLHEYFNLISGLIDLAIACLVLLASRRPTGSIPAIIWILVGFFAVSGLDTSTSPAQSPAPTRRSPSSWTSLAWSPCPRRRHCPETRAHDHRILRTARFQADDKRQAMLDRYHGM